MENENTTTAAGKVNGYKVTPETAALLDCLKSTDKLYTQIVEALQPLYGFAGGIDTTDRAMQPYYEKLSGINNLLNEEITRRIMDGIGDLTQADETATEI